MIGRFGPALGRTLERGLAGRVGPRRQARARGRRQARPGPGPARPPAAARGRPPCSRCCAARRTREHPDDADDRAARFRAVDEERAAPRARAAVLEKPVRSTAARARIALRARAGRDDAREARAAARLARPVDELPSGAAAPPARMRANGVLHFEKGKQQQGGRAARRRPSRCARTWRSEALGQRLVARGRIDGRGAARVAAAREARRGAAGRSAGRDGAISRGRSSQALAEQAEEKLFEMFAWTERRVADPARIRASRARNALALGWSAASLILRGVRTRAPIGADRRYLARARRAPASCAGESPFYSSRTSSSSRRGAHCRAARRRHCASARSRAGPVRAPRLYALWLLGAVRAARPSTPDRRARARRRPGRRGRARDTQRSASARARYALATMRGREALRGARRRPRRAAEDVRAAYSGARRALRTPDRFAASSARCAARGREVFALVSAPTRCSATGDAARAVPAREAAPSASARRSTRASALVSAEPQFQKGEAALRARRTDRALEAFETAVEPDPGRGRVPRAARLGAAPAVADPGDPAARRTALRHIKQGRKLARDRAKPYLFLGRSELAEGRLGRAERMFRRPSSSTRMRRGAPRAPPDQHAAREGEGPRRAAPPVADEEVVRVASKRRADLARRPARAWDDAKVHVLTHTLHYGLGVFEGIRCYRTDDGALRGVPPARARRRLFESAHIILMTDPVLARGDRGRPILETLRANRLAEGYIRPLVFIGRRRDGADPADNPIRVAIDRLALGRVPGRGGHGARHPRAGSRATRATT